jgi:hypothetical protein
MVSNWRYKDKEITLSATAAEQERYRVAAQKVGWVKSDDLVEAHAAGAWRQACRGRTLPRLSKKSGGT